ncbi:membrane protein [Xanthomonas oryzae pv. oryzae PXO86]|nr:membrane protein [Xanthomonas oryzae pv. oryzae PXO86]
MSHRPQAAQHHCADRTQGNIVGAALAPRQQHGIAALPGATTAVAAAYLTFNARMRAIERYGQTNTGVVEDATSVGAATLIVRDAAKR